MRDVGEDADITGGDCEETVFWGPERFPFDQEGERIFRAKVNRWGDFANNKL